jgi:protein dithiol:quinone oxidoreductase
MRIKMKSLINNRNINLLGFIATVTAMLTAIFYFQGVLDLNPCNLCIFQRVGMVGSSLVFLILAIVNPKGWGARFGAFMGLIASGFGAFVAGYHLWVQAQPAGSVACGQPLTSMIDMSEYSGQSWFDIFIEVFAGAGSCGDILWSLFGLSIPGWTLVAFVGVMGLFLAQLILGQVKIK